MQGPSRFGEPRVAHLVHGLLSPQTFETAITAHRAGQSFAVLIRNQKVHVSDPQPLDDSVAHREQSASRVLEGYIERRTRRRAEDTFFGSSELLRDSMRAFPTEEMDSRRSSILDEAREQGFPDGLAELLYDIAWEEGIDPAIGFELVRTGLGVAPPDKGLVTGAQTPTVDRYLPTWMFPPTPPDQLLRERILRVSFRRLRGLLEAEQDPREAFRRFANEPDVGHYGY